MTGSVQSARQHRRAAVDCVVTVIEMTASTSRHSCRVAFVCVFALFSSALLSQDDDLLLWHELLLAAPPEFIAHLKALFLCSRHLSPLD